MLARAAAVAVILAISGCGLCPPETMDQARLAPCPIEELQRVRDAAAVLIRDGDQSPEAGGAFSMATRALAICSGTAPPSANNPEGTRPSWLLDQAKKWLGAALEKPGEI